MPRSQLRLPLAAVFVALVAVRHRPAGSWARRRLVAGLRSAAPQALSLPPPHPLSFLRRRLVGVSMRSSHCQDPAGSTAPLLVIRSEVLLCTRWRAHTVYSKGVLTRHAHHGVRTTQRLAVAAAAASSLLLRPRLVPTRSSRFPRCRGRKGTGLPPAPQLRGPRSTTSPRSPASSSSWTRLVRRPRLAPAPPLTQHRSCAHPWQAPRPRDGRCRS